MMRIFSGTGFLPPTRSTSRFLQDAQQLCLQAHRHLGYFVEQQGAILSLLELAGLSLLTRR
jgi:hypothetical protein